MVQRVECVVRGVATQGVGTSLRPVVLGVASVALQGHFA